VSNDADEQAEARRVRDAAALDAVLTLAATPVAAPPLSAPRQSAEAPMPPSTDARDGAAGETAAVAARVYAGLRRLLGGSERS
jgi:hypothetical protein